VDFVTTPGITVLVHDHRRVVEEDRKTTERWQVEGSFFDYEVLDENADALKCGQFGCFTFSREQLVKSFEF